MFNPNFRISPALLTTLKRIAVQVHDLNKQVSQSLTNLNLLSEARAQSAYASTTIEGNPLALTAVKALLKNRPGQVAQSEREVLNYNEALTRLEAETFSEDAVLELHKNVTENLLVKEKTGAYRQEPVFIHTPLTGDVVFLPPDHQDVPELMADLYAFLDENEALDPVILAGLFHKQFVLIHPFVDGNGRTVRLASTSLLRDLGINLFSLLSFETYYNQNITRYFEFVGERGNYYELNVNFTNWLEYFAEGILSELQRLGKTLELAQTKALRLKKHHERLLEYLGRRGSITDKDYAGLVDRAKATRALDFKTLLTAGLIERRGKGPGTYYVLKDSGQV